MTDSLPPFDLGEPGPMRERLVEAVLAGRKTATSSLRVYYDMDNAWLPRVGNRFSLVNSARDQLGTVETTRVDVLRLADVTDDVARAEGEGFGSAADWRAAHLAYWDQYREQVRTFLGDPGWTIGDGTEVVVEYFQLI
ncbi:ASCH domain-containing protein [Solicola gregarius]|uniref:ASCH domain-containing protein n=1 Tax=Solicola gregarius TaxID=2908642 RepID=A0AA46YK35_9ACTN|nr:ASCH domain-containing protein [Solicola gregarius]UYM05280.1 ASCH domain-containing protein [Solicola gregarius]